MNIRSEKSCPRNDFPLAKAARTAAALLTTMLAGALFAASPGQSGKNLGDLSLEELMNESVTSVSGHEQRLGDAAAAIAVLSNDDLRRSGATTIMDALRLVPGMDVGAVNSSQMAVSARGFNGVFSNKLLVLVDGRAVYNPLFSGVYWDLQQTIMEDVDRVEVIRGPGATIWGANAVNGVVSVVTRSARDTQGTLVYGGAGDVHQAMGGVRYGGRAGENTYYRTFVSYQATADYPLANGQPAGDRWQSTHGGFRLDHYPDQDTQLTWQAEATAVDLYDRTADANNINTLGRWTRQLSADSGVEVQAYYDRTSRNDAANLYAVVDTVDVTAQHTLTIDPRDAIVWGLGYRFTDTALKPAPPFIIIRKSHVHLHLFNVFVQDELKVVPDKFTLTAGIKVEHNDFTNFEFQPSVRMTFKPTAQQTLWAAVSRAVRTPSETEGRDMFTALAGPPSVGPGGGLYVPTLVGDTNPIAEVLWAYELGYRIQAGRRVNVDLTSFYNDYTNLISVGGVDQFIPGVPFGEAMTPFSNIFKGQTYGGEASATLSPADGWKVTAGYSLLFVHIQGPAVTSRAVLAGSSPKSQASLRSAYDFTTRATLDAQLRYVSAIQFVPAYLTADVRLSYRPTHQLELALVGQNLFDPQHPEQPAQPTTVTTEVPRGFFAEITWRF